MTFMLGHVTFRQEDRRLVSCLLFWQDVTDYGKEEDRSADRLLRLCHAWNIYNLYFPDGSNYPIGRPHCLHTCMWKQWDVIGQYYYQHKGDWYCIVDYFGCFDQRYSESVWIFYVTCDLRTSWLKLLSFSSKCMWYMYLSIIPPPTPSNPYLHHPILLVSWGKAPENRHNGVNGVEWSLAFLLNFVEEASTVFRRNAKLYQI